MEFVGALSTLNMNLNFLIAILVVLAVILTAVIVMAMYRSAIALKPFFCNSILAYWTT